METRLGPHSAHSVRICSQKASLCDKQLHLMCCIWLSSKWSGNLRGVVQASVCLSLAPPPPQSNIVIRDFQTGKKFPFISPNVQIPIAYQHVQVLSSPKRSTESLARCSTIFLRRKRVIARNLLLCTWQGGGGGREAAPPPTPTTVVTR